MSVKKSWKWKIGIPGEFLTAWLLMLTLGGIHDSRPVIPALGYVVCLGIAWTISFLRPEQLAHFSRKS